MSTIEQRTAAPKVEPKTDVQRGNRLLLLLADEHDKQEKLGGKLDMRTTHHECGTPACSLGHALAIPAISDAIRAFSSTSKPFALTGDLAPDWCHLFSCENQGRTHADQSRIIREFVASRL